MGIAFGVILAFLLVASALAVFVTVPAPKLGKAIRMFVPSAMIAVGGLLALTGRVNVGLGLVGIGAAWIARNRSVGSVGTASGKRSTVRSAMFEMELDHDTGEMDGLVLTGGHEGRWLSAMSDTELVDLLASVIDAESRALLEAYLDRRISGWREHADADTNAGQGSPASSGPMTKQEAYQILGLEPGAGSQEVREAHRRLMKRVHPDSGGSTFLAAKINEAKDILLD